MTEISREPKHKKEEKYSVEEYPEFRDVLVTKDTKPLLHGGVNYTTKRGMEAAVVYLHELCELE